MEESGDIRQFGATSLKFTSCQAQNADGLCEAITRFVGGRLGIRTEFVGEIAWQERARQFDLGEIQICWLCGWPYVNKVDGNLLDLDLIAAPVMMHPRYGDRPVYFSDIVVHTDSVFHSFDDLRGAAWAYNEPMSHSGYNVVRHFLAGQGIFGGFFGSIVESGSHQASLDLVLSRALDASAIDSTVLETIVRLRPEIALSLRVIATLGPSPAPPWVMHPTVPRDVGNAVRREFLNMHANPDGSGILRDAGVRRFEAIDDGHYNPIRQMTAAAAKALL